jgi:hypothetical protein
MLPPDVRSPPAAGRRLRGHYWKKSMAPAAWQIERVSLCCHRMVSAGCVDTGRRWWQRRGPRLPGKVPAAAARWSRRQRGRCTQRPRVTLIDHDEVAVAQHLHEDLLRSRVYHNFHKQHLWISRHQILITASASSRWRVAMGWPKGLMGGDWRHAAPTY